MNNLNKRNPIASAIKLALLATAATSILTVNTAFAAEEDEEASSENKVVVTGSRLRRQVFESPSAVTVISAEQIERSGLVTLGDMLAKMPQLDSTFTSQNSGNFIGTAGVGSLDLRGLGTERTLVLVDGRRHVSGSPGSGAVDVNSLPSILIERIEIITGANAAVYGADAVTGVVNFILKRDVEDTLLRSYYSTAEDSGFETRGMSFLSGSSFAEDKGHVTFAVSYDKQDELTAAQRGGRFTQLIGSLPNPLDGDVFVPAVGDTPAFTRDDGIPDRINVPNRGFFIITDGGATPLSGGRTGQFQPDGSLRIFNPATDFEFSDGSRCGGVGCSPLDLSTFNDLQVGFSRYTIDANFRYQVGDATEVYVDTRYAAVTANQQGQPSFNFGDLTIAGDNAFVSPEVSAITGGNGFNLRRFNTDFGRRKEIDQRNTFRIVVGAEGDFDEWEWDAFASYGASTSQKSNLNNRIDERFFNAADAVRLSQGDIDAIASNGVGRAELAGAQVGDVACRSVLQAATGASTGQSAFAIDGCVPVNLLGNGNASQAAIDWFTQTAIGILEAEQYNYSGYVSNDDLFSTWAGEVGVVLGAEYRKERVQGNEDTASALGLTFFNALSVSEGEYDAFDVFGEISIPLLNDVFLAQNVTLEAAVRQSDYSTIGSFTTWETRLNWEINDEIRVRVTTGEAVRAPNIGELFSPPGQNFFGINDPCDFEQLENAANGIANRIANCQALGIADPQSFVANDAVTVEGSSGGNPNLKGEESQTTTLGIVYSPSWLDGLNIAIDYYDIEITKAIANTGAQAILNRCVDDPNGIDNQFCGLNDRDSVTRDVAFIRSSPVNLNTFIAKGYDFEADYALDLDDMGKINFTFAGSYTDTRTLILNTADNIDSLEGEVGTPEWQGRLSVNWAYNDLNVFGTYTFIDSVLNGQKENIFDEDDPNTDATDVLFLSNKKYLNLGASYAVTEGLKAQLLINNVTDELPPFPFFGTGTGSAIYDNIGRSYSLTLDYRF